MKRILLSILCLVAAATPAVAGPPIYKCEDAAGRTVYQQLPCPETADGGPMAIQDNGRTSGGKAESAIDEDNPLLRAYQERLERRRQGRAAQAQRLRARVAERRRLEAIRAARVEGRIVPGMTATDVEAVLGEPTRVSRRKSRSGWREHWTYERPGGQREHVSFEAGEVVSHRR